MASLREPVIITTPGGDLRGELLVGTNGLPVLHAQYDGFCRHSATESTATYHQHWYSPWTIPAAWTVCPIHAAGWGVLYDAWTDIEAARQHIRDAQREAEAEERSDGADKL